MKMWTETYTPGPWEVSTKKDFKHTSDDYHQIVALGGPRSDGPGFSITGCISIHDARLIAAAPDLLQALIEISELKAISGVPEHLHALITAMKISAKEAIKKATK